MEVFRCTTKQEAKVQAAGRLNRILDTHAHVPTLFLSSGGSSMELLELVEIFPPNVTVGMTDERFSKDPAINNFAQLTETSFFQRAQERGAYFFDTRVQVGEDLEAFAGRMNEFVKTWIENHPEGRIIITQGVGPDAHTLGIMPYPKAPGTFHELFDKEEVWVAGYDAGAKNPHSLRVTVTLLFLRRVDHAVTYMVGVDKKEALQSILKEQGTVAEAPARILREMKEVTIFTDIADS